MSDRLHYFAYGSNMSFQRLRARVPSAEFVCAAELAGHVLKFHKPSQSDGSGKCDAWFSGSDGDRMHGGVFSIEKGDLPVLDGFEGIGFGYERKQVVVHTKRLGHMQAETYLATRFDPFLRPLDWYKEHVVRGAKAIGLPRSYVASIEAVECDADSDAQRRSHELAIYA